MKLRASPYIEFDTGVVITQPMKMAADRPAPWSLDDMLDLFECRVDVWQFGPAVQVLKRIEKARAGGSCIWAHSAYALLSIVFPYFEMIGKTLNPGSKARGSASRDFNHGFCDVYPAFESPDGDRSDSAIPSVTEFRDRVRNGLFHLGYTKGNLFLHNEPTSRVPDDFAVDNTGPAPLYLVNPHRVTRTVVGHFPTFMARLRDRDSRFDDLRARFARFFEEFHGLQ